MRHRVAGNKFGRRTNVVKGLYRSIAFELFEHGRIETTVAKAKAVRGMVDKLVILGKTDSPNNRRMIAKIMGHEHLLDRIYKEVSPALASRNSGFTRIIRTGKRTSDTADMGILEFVEPIATKAPVVKAEVVNAEVEPAVETKKVAPKTKKVAAAAKPKAKKVAAKKKA